MRAPPQGAGRVPGVSAVVPVEVSVPKGVRCVIVSGPNTGGKTAAAKALAIACLMAKVGLFVPGRIVAVPWVSRLSC